MRQSTSELDEQIWKVRKQLEIEVPPTEAVGAETLVMQVPEGAAPGTQLTVTAPTGQQVSLTVPDGAVAGTQLCCALDNYIQLFPHDSNPESKSAQNLPKHRF